MATAKHDLGTTFFVTNGVRGDKLPVILLHGGPGSTHHINVPLLSSDPKRRFITYDQIGCGRSSDLPKSRWKVKTFVDELRALVAHWGFERFHLFGVSWGTTLALEYTLATRGEHVASLIFQSPFFSATDWMKDASRLIRAMPAETQKVIRACQEVGATDAQVYKKALEDYYLRHVLRSKTKLRSGRKRKNPNGRAIYQHMWGPSEFCATGVLKNYERADQLKRIKVPTLFVCGEHDEATPKTVRRYHRAVQGSQFEVIPNASHAIAAERPAALRKIMRQFLRDQD